MRWLLALGVFMFVGGVLSERARDAEIRRAEEPIDNGEEEAEEEGAEE